MAVVAPSRTWGVQPSGVWDKGTMLQQVRQAAGRAYDRGDESEGKGGRLWQCPNYGWVNVWNNDVRRLSLRMAPNVLYLDVSNNDIRTLEEVAGGANLVYLDASSNDIGKGGRLGLPVPGTVVMACLEGLNLANNDIGPHIPAGAMDWCPNVRAVSLNDNDIVSFPDDPMWPQLQVLNLANNNLVRPHVSLAPISLALPHTTRAHALIPVTGLDSHCSLAFCVCSVSSRRSRAARTSARSISTRTSLATIRSQRSAASSTTTLTSSGE